MGRQRYDQAVREQGNTTDAVVADFEALQPSDQADVVRRLSTGERTRLWEALPDHIVARIFQELTHEELAAYVSELDRDRVALILAAVSFDDVADLLAELPDEDADRVLALMDSSDAAEVRELMAYHDDTAGGLMTTEFVALEEGWTVARALDWVRRFGPHAETIYYLYVIDRTTRLTGVLSLRDLILADPDAPVAEVMNRNPISVRPETDQERVARLIEKYDFLALPVTDEEGSMLGIVTVDDVIDVVQEEATEDISRLGGLVGDAEDLDHPGVRPWLAARKRLPWLTVLMLVGLLAGNIIARFERTLETVVVLAFFIPMMADMAGNTGTQALTVVVRGLALGDIGPRDAFRLVRREAGVGLIIGTINGVLISLIAGIWQRSLALGLVLGFSLWLTLLAATLSGTVVPLALHRLRVDPAVASGPFITTINDLIGLTIYFTVATAFIKFLL